MTKVLITGASSGIGKELALLFAKEGAELIIHGRNGENLQNLFVELAKMTKVKFLLADLATFDGSQLLLKLINEEIPDVVINSAGFGVYGGLITHSQQELQSMIATNCAAIVAINHAAATLWKERGIYGTILNISSVVGFVPTPQASVYAETKAFVSSFSQALDVELEPYNIRVLTACPGSVATAFAERASKGHITAQKPRMMRLSAQEVAKAIRQQIKEKKPITIIDWKYRVLMFLRKFVTTRFAMLLLNKALKSRVKAS